MIYGKCPPLVSFAGRKNKKNGQGLSTSPVGRQRQGKTFTLQS
jgi:hypothetical protein